MGTAPPRIVDLQGGHNFRDLGGYVTQDGTTLRPGLVFRSGMLAELTPEDLQQVDALGIRVILDLRSNRERASRPTRWPRFAVVDRWVRDHEGSVGEFVHSLTLPDASSAWVRESMVEAYRELPYEQADSYRELFRRVAGSDLPLLFHCSAGKDRTGVAAALLLSALDVSRDRIIEDYLLTDRFFERGLALVLGDPSMHRLTGVKRDLLEPMLRAERLYIEAMFQFLEQRHGSVDAYLQEVLGMDAVMHKQLRLNMLA
jgi:protein-tyrosine phosphatase